MIKNCDLCGEKMNVIEDVQEFVWGINRYHGKALSYHCPCCGYEKLGTCKVQFWEDDYPKEESGSEEKTKESDNKSEEVSKEAQNESPDISDLVIKEEGEDISREQREAFFNNAAAEETWETLKEVPSENAAEDNKEQTTAANKKTSAFSKLAKMAQGIMQSFMEDAPDSANDAVKEDDAAEEQPQESEPSIDDDIDDEMPEFSPKSETIKNLNQKAKTESETEDKESDKKENLNSQDDVNGSSLEENKEINSNTEEKNEEASEEDAEESEKIKTEDSEPESNKKEIAAEEKLEKETDEGNSEKEALTENQSEHEMDEEAENGPKLQDENNAENSEMPPPMYEKENEKKVLSVAWIDYMFLNHPKTFRVWYKKFVNKQQKERYYLIKHEPSISVIINDTLYDTGKAEKYLERYRDTGNGTMKQCYYVTPSGNYFKILCMMGKGDELIVMEEKEVKKLLANDPPTYMRVIRSEVKE